MTLGARVDHRSPSSRNAVDVAAAACDATQGRNRIRRIRRRNTARASIDDNSDKVASRQMIAHHEEPIP